MYQDEKLVDNLSKIANANIFKRLINNIQSQKN